MGEKNGGGLRYFFMTSIAIGKVGKEEIWYRERISYRMTSILNRRERRCNIQQLLMSGQVSNEDDEQT